VTGSDDRRVGSRAWTPARSAHSCGEPLHHSGQRDAGFLHLSRPGSMVAGEHAIGPGNPLAPCFSSPLCGWASPRAPSSANRISGHPKECSASCPASPAPCEDQRDVSPMKEWAAGTSEHRWTCLLSGASEHRWMRRPLRFNRRRVITPPRHGRRRAQTGQQTAAIKPPQTRDDASVRGRPRGRSRWSQLGSTRRRSGTRRALSPARPVVRRPWVRSTESRARYRCGVARSGKTSCAKVAGSWKTSCRPVPPRAT